MASSEAIYLFGTICGNDCLAGDTAEQVGYCRVIAFLRVVSGVFFHSQLSAGLALVSSSRETISAWPRADAW